MNECLLPLGLKTKQNKTKQNKTKQNAKGMTHYVAMIQRPQTLKEQNTILLFSSLTKYPCTPLVLCRFLVYKQCH